MRAVGEQRSEKRCEENITHLSFDLWYATTDLVTIFDSSENGYQSEISGEDETKRATRKNKTSSREERE